MERSRLKTIIILILAMINLALALSLGLRLAQGRAAEAALLMELRQRFTAEGCALPETIPSDGPPMVVTMERDSSREQASVPAAPSTSTASSSTAPSSEASSPVRPPTKNRVMMAIRVGNFPLQGTSEEVRMAMSRSLGLSMIRQPVTPQALQPRLMHMVRACLPQALAF